MESPECNCQSAKAYVKLSINRSTVESFAWLSWQKRGELPLKGGIYFIEVNFGIAYVGKANNLRSRWKNHERLTEIEMLYQEACIRYLVIEDSDERSQAEAAFNKYFNPPWDGRVWRQIGQSRWGNLSKNGLASQLKSLGTETDLQLDSLLHTMEVTKHRILDFYGLNRRH